MPGTQFLHFILRLFNRLNELSILCSNLGSKVLGPRLSCSQMLVEVCQLALDVTVKVSVQT